MKLLSVLSYFVAIIERKKNIDFNNEYNRLETIITNTEFFIASEIKLTFNHQTEIIEGPSLNVFREVNKFYFKGKWSSPLTMFGLIPELSVLLDVTGLNDELRLLLQLPEEDIKEWMVGQGFDLSRVEFQKNSKLSIIEPSIEELSNVAEPTIEYLDEVGEINFAVTEPFVPESNPKEFDVSKVEVTTKHFVILEQIAKSNYSEISSQEVREDVGRWSEEFVNEFLTRNHNNFSEIIWKNKDGESGSPYDFKIVENGIEKYIEAKGTPSCSKDVIYLSPNEWIFMFEKGAEYSLYRVYDAGKSNARIEIVENPSDLLRQGKIFPNPITLQV